MKASPAKEPLILCIGGHDPTGGAGIQADIETVTALGCRALTLITALTEQDTGNVHAVAPLDAASFRRYRDRLLSDMSPDAIKIGLVSDAALCKPIAELRVLGVPMVLDPVLAAGGGTDLAGNGLVEALREHLLPECTLLTPNRAEARRISGQADIDDSAARLLRMGAGAVLITGADEAEGNQVTNRLFREGAVLDYHWERLPHRYHGSGCTLASACAAQLGAGRPLPEAVERAQAFTWQSLAAATRPGPGQYLPRRRPVS